MLVNAFMSSHGPAAEELSRDDALVLAAVVGVVDPCQRLIL
jgi:hypothetical protein